MYTHGCVLHAVAAAAMVRVNSSYVYTVRGRLYWVTGAVGCTRTSWIESLDYLSIH